MSVTEYNGVVFHENYPSDFIKGQKVSTTLDGFFSSSQISSLVDVKKAMADYCKSNCENTIVGFTYGQRSLGFFASIFSRDNVVWYGEGYIGISID